MGTMTGRDLALFVRVLQHSSRKGIRVAVAFVLPPAFLTCNQSVEFQAWQMAPHGQILSQQHMCSNHEISIMKVRQSKASAAGCILEA